MTHDSPGGRRIDAALQLLDHQLIDRDGLLVGKIDDLELEQRDDGKLVVTAILTGPGSLGPRLPGVLGRSWVAVWRRLHEDSEPRPARIAWSAVSEIASALTLATARQDLPNQSLENWARAQIIAKLPGAGHAPE